MRNMKSWLIASFVTLALVGGIALFETATAQPAQAQGGRGMDDHWRFHDGHWSQYNSADKRWYYTNGNHWYYNDGKSWHPYAFDGHFGRKGFERGNYKAPGRDVAHPQHGVYHP